MGKDKVASLIARAYEMGTTLPPSVASFSDDGEYFVIKDVPAFTAQLPKYFRHSNFKSFVRQLNYYGFRKLREDDCTFHHEHFRRGRPDLLKLIKPKQPASAPAPAEPEAAQSPLVVQLTGDVKNLQSQVDTLTSQLEYLTMVVQQLVASGLVRVESQPLLASFLSTTVAAPPPGATTSLGSAPRVPTVPRAVPNSVMAPPSPPLPPHARSAVPSVTSATAMPPPSQQPTTTAGTTTAHALPMHPRKRGRPRSSADRSQSPPQLAPTRRAPTVPTQPVVATPATAGASRAPVASAVCVATGWCAAPQPALGDDDGLLDVPDLDQLPTAMPSLADQVHSMSLNDDFGGSGSGGSGLLGYSSGSDSDILPDVDSGALFFDPAANKVADLERTPSFEMLQELLLPSPTELTLTRSASVDHQSSSSSSPASPNKQPQTQPVATAVPSPATAPAGHSRRVRGRRSQACGGTTELRTIPIRAPANTAANLPSAWPPAA